MVVVMVVLAVVMVDDAVVVEEVNGYVMPAYKKIDHEKDTNVHDV